ncbi:hypothetical protein DL95DRAFT_524404 [Leptodontidium sp. 2 PMI_412]|nr:hypothetical protein DL95DRAFT_524404 [Leptodontidium sp. 2 PMI_412]
MSTAQTFNSRPVAATLFPQFPSLPTEIRRLIWQAAAFPRIVYLEKVEESEHICSRVWSQTPVDGPDMMGFFDLDHQPVGTELGYGPDPIWGFRSRSVPVLFYVCRESYSVALKVYSKCFGTDSSAPATWFNFNLDTLYLDWGDLESRIMWSYRELNYSPKDLSDDVKGVQNLALHNGSMAASYIDRILHRCGNVLSLTMVPRLIDVTDLTSLVYLDEEDGLETAKHRVEDEEIHVHPVIQSDHPEWESEYNDNHLWHCGDNLWSTVDTTFFQAENMNLRPTDPANSNRLKWARPRLQLKPIVTSRQKLDILHRRQLYDAQRETGWITVSLLAMNNDTLELSVPPLTTMEGLITTFCQAMDIDVLENGSAFRFAPFIHCHNDDDRYRDPGKNHDRTVFSYFHVPGEKLRFYIYFRQGSPQRPDCTIFKCEVTLCEHVQEWERLLSMEAEDD